MLLKSADFNVSSLRRHSPFSVKVLIKIMIRYLSLKKTFISTFYFDPFVLGRETFCRCSFVWNCVKFEGRSRFNSTDPKLKFSPKIENILYLILWTSRICQRATRAACPLVFDAQRSFVWTSDNNIFRDFLVVVVQRMAYLRSSSSHTWGFSFKPVFKSQLATWCPNQATV